MHDENPTIIPPQCAACLQFEAKWLENFKRPAPEPFRCNTCRPLGQRIADALYEDFLWWTGFLAWNLTIAALLETAAVQAIRELESVRDVLRQAWTEDGNTYNIRRGAVRYMDGL